MVNSHNQFYSYAELYDIAFDYRNLAQEVDFLLNCYQEAWGQAPQSVLELAAGPARHALACAQRQLKASALDLSPEMVAYGQQLAQTAGAELHYQQGDMRDFALPAPVDLAFILLDSTAYLLTQDDFLAHLKAVAQNLNPEGLYLLEMAHPADFLTPGKTVNTDWEMERDGIQVDIRWGTPEDYFDPIEQISDVKVCLDAQTPQGKIKVRETAAQRCYTFQEMLGILKQQSDFRLYQAYGAFDPDIDLHNTRAWRMILALQKTAA